MHIVEPRVFLIGETRAIEEGLQEYLEYVGAPEWTTDASTDSEKLIEFYGRLCYRSFKPELNPNVSKVRKGNDTYLNNIVKVKHGSVMEHATLNFVFADVSRVFTHELVRHRMGVAISQESLRYVRLSDLGFWAPVVIEENEDAMKIFVETFDHLEQLQLDLAKMFDLDNPEVNFAFKKTVTSAMRRIAPIGLSTAIGWSVNIRALRWILQLRTQPAAEFEIRYVFDKVGQIVKKRYPNLFGDFKTEIVNGIPQWISSNSKV